MCNWIDGDLSATLKVLDQKPDKEKLTLLIPLSFGSSIFLLLKSNLIDFTEYFAAIESKFLLEAFNIVSFNLN